MVDFYHLARTALGTPVTSGLVGHEFTPTRNFDLVFDLFAYPSEALSGSIIHIDSVTSFIFRLFVDFHAS